MMNLRTIQDLDLTSRDTLQTVEAMADEIVQYRLRPEAYEMLKSLVGRLRFLERNDLGPQWHEYDRVITKLKFIAFADLAEKDAVQFIQEHIVDAFEIGISLKDQFQQRFVELDITERDELKKKIRDAMIGNSQMVTSTPITLGDGAPVQPTLSNWLKDYTSHVSSALATPAQISAYFTRSKNIINLTANDREKISQLLRLYEYLKFPSDTVEGLDQPRAFSLQGTSYVVIEGEIIRVGASIGTDRSSARASQPDQSGLQQQIRQALQAPFDEERQYEDEQALLATIGSDERSISTALIEALKKNDGHRAISLISILSRLGLVNSLLSNPQIVKMWMQEFFERLQADESSRSAASRYIQTHQSDPEITAAVVQWILNRSLSGNEPEAARIGNRLENALAALGQTEFVGMTYFDVSQGAFRWTPMKVNPDGSLDWTE